jgi:hypothetical protein
MLGYFFFGVTGLIVIGFTLFNTSKPNLIGDNAMGYGLGLAFFGLVFTISSLVLTLCVGWKGGFNWVSDQNTTRYLIVGLGWLSMAVATFACAAFKWEWHKGEFPQFLHSLAKSNGQTWIPLLMLVPYFYLLSAELRASVAPQVYKMPLTIAFVLTVFMALAILFGWLNANRQQNIRTVESQKKSYDNLQKQHLDYINAQKLTDPILNLTALSGRFNPQEVRSVAAAKIKAHPNWEAELIALLNNDYYYAEAYHFIDGNTVEHPELFIEALNNSILRMANDIHKNIKNSNNLQDWHFEHFSIERLFRAIDEQFLNKGMDFKPAVLTLQQALATPPPERFKNVRFTVVPVVNNWLKTH